jgi:molecular chaperone DnaK (HSP70)
MPTYWAVDLGTTNTVTAMADETGVHLVHLPHIVREMPLPQSPLVPSAVHIYQTQQRWLLFFRRNVLQVLIGQQALDQNFDGLSPSFAQSFKRLIGSESQRPIVRINNQQFSVRDVTRLFLRELLSSIRQQFQRRVTDLTISAPVGFYETYRAELQAIVRSLGVKRFRSVDEPIAAALGYGVNVTRDETLLVFDFGGGTLNLAAIRLGGHAAEVGAAPVLAKHMVLLGGDDVDRWIIEKFVPGTVRDIPAWHQDLKWEAARVKEQASLRGESIFQFRGLKPQPFTRQDLVEILAARKLYEEIHNALMEMRRQLDAASVPDDHKRVDEVLLVGGSTLLPEVAGLVDELCRPAIVRYPERQPELVFTYVALGAARFASGTPIEDHIYHDYALSVHNDRTRKVEYELLVPRSTRYPTSQSFIERYYADYNGMTDMSFRVCEIGRLGHAPVAWEHRPNGASYWVPQTESHNGMVVTLNPADEPIRLTPSGRGSSPRLRVTYSVNADRWLCMTVYDLVRKAYLRIEEPVVRLR